MTCSLVGWTQKETELGPKQCLLSTSASELIGLFVLKASFVRLTLIWGFTQAWDASHWWWKQESLLCAYSNYLHFERSHSLQLHRGAQASLNKARLHSCTEKRERHYHIDGSLRSGQVAHQQFPAFPGGFSLAFSDFELIKARGDGKAMLSL